MLKTKRMRQRIKETKAKLGSTPLPKGIELTDTLYPPYTEKDGNTRANSIPYDDTEFMLYLVESYGWCIATLHIRNPGRRHSSLAQTARTYAVTLDGKLVRIGLGPHVKQTLQIYVRESRLPVLLPYIELLRKGRIDANITRDRISTRRAQGTMRSTYW